MGIVYAYSRFSTKSQAKGRSADRQRERAEAYCKRHGHTLDTTLNLKDDGTSALHGKNIKTGKLGLFIEEVKGGIVKPGARILFENVDRFSRDEVKNSLKI